MLIRRPVDRWVTTLKIKSRSDADCPVNRCCVKKVTNSVIKLCFYLCLFGFNISRRDTFSDPKRKHTPDFSIGRVIFVFEISFAHVLSAQRKREMNIERVVFSLVDRVKGHTVKHDPVSGGIENTCFGNSARTDARSEGCRKRESLR